MNTIKFKVSFIRTKNFMEGGKRLFKSDTYNNIMDKYLLYPKDLGQSYNTLRHKITSVTLFLDYLENNNISALKKLNKQNVYNYIKLYDSYNHVLSYKDRNKLNIRLFLNW